ncbi:MAG: class I SAM-dependent methyltransferase [Gaiellaceae bacterium]
MLDVRPGMVVGDLGPGAGHFTLRMARAVEPDGVAYAIDASQRTLDELRTAADEHELMTLRTVPVSRDRLDIPEPVDLLFVSATYHHLPQPPRYFAAARAHLRPGGRVAILEITRPRGVLAPFYRLWFDGLVPLLGKALPGGSAYTYLPASVRRFPGPEELVELLRAARFGDVRWKTFAGGIVALHIGVASA